MKTQVEVKKIDGDCIEILGVRYYDEDYCIEMNRREYQRGLKNGQQVHVAHFDKTFNTKEK